MRILIYGAGFENKGAEAMLKTVQAQMAARIPGSAFHYPRCYPAYWPILEREGLKAVPFRKRGQHLGVIAQSPALMRHVPLCRNIDVPSMLADVDAVLDASGYAYGDAWGPKLAGRTAAMVTYARAMNKPYILLPQAYGPFEKPAVAPLCRRICSDAPLAYVRDSASLDYIRKLFGGSPPSTIRSCPDIAFLFEGAPAASATPILEELGLAGTGRPLAGLAPNMRVYERAPGIGTQNRYIRVLVDLARFLVDAGYDVVLLPHHVEQSDDGIVDDRLYCSLVEAEARRDNVKALLRRLSAADMKAIVGHMRFMMGSRFHALIAALSQGIPAYAISWSHKYKELLRPFGLEAYVTGIDDLDRAGAESLAKAAQFVEVHERLADQVRLALPDIKASVARSFDDVATLLRGAPASG